MDEPAIQRLGPTTAIRRVARKWKQVTQRNAHRLFVSAQK
jgi:hypothetical protein